jgi:hypothetical protein
MSNIQKYYIACFNRRSQESCCVFPLRQYICKSCVFIVVSGRVWYGWWVGILFPCNWTRLVRGNLQQMHFFICIVNIIYCFLFSPTVKLCYIRAYIEHYQNEVKELILQCCILTLNSLHMHNTCRIKVHVLLWLLWSNIKYTDLNRKENVLIVFRLWNYAYYCGQLWKSTVMVIWFITPCGIISLFQGFRGMCCLHL